LGETTFYSNPRNLDLSMPNYFIPLLPEHVYHLQSWANGNEKLFREQENYRFFLERFVKYVYPVAELYSYSLLPDHFDLLLEIKNINEIKKHYNLLKPESEFDETQASAFVMKCFSNMLNSYAKSFNKVYQRRGSVFIDYVRRVEIISKEDICNTIIQIHKAPLYFGYCKRFEQWNWSSFKKYNSRFPYIVATNKVLQLFGGRNNFFDCHRITRICQPFIINLNSL
jgi:putative transposase